MDEIAARAHMIAGIDYTGVFVGTYCHDGKGNFVMVKRSSKSRDSHGVWDFGGGTVEFGEKLDDTVRREVKEEFGVEPISLEQLGAVDVISDVEDRHWIGVFYKVLVDREQLYNAEPEIHEELSWFKLDSLPEMVRPVVHTQLARFGKYLK